MWQRHRPPLICSIATAGVLTTRQYSKHVVPSADARHAFCRIRKPVAKLPALRPPREHLEGEILEARIAGRLAPAHAPDAPPSASASASARGDPPSRRTRHLAIVQREQACLAARGIVSGARPARGGEGSGSGSASSRSFISMPWLVPRGC